MSDPKESAPKESADSLSPEDLDKVAGGDAPIITEMCIRDRLGADLYQAYKITSAEGKLYMLKGLLKHRLSMSISKALSARDAVPEKLPPEISAALAADQGVPF